MSRKVSSAVLVFSLLVVVCLLAGVAWHRGDTDGGPYRQLDVMTDVFGYINQDYVTPPDLAKVGDGALHGLLESLDADSSYLNPAEYQSYQEQQKQNPLGVTGALLSKRVGYAEVVDVQPGSPAAQAGLMRGDFVEAIGDAGTHDLSLAAIKQDFAGAPGTAVTLSVVHLHQSDPVKITVHRALAQALALNTSVHDGIGVIGVPDFNPGRAAQISAAVAALRQQGATRFVLDLRNCGFGTFGEAEQTANLFLKAGTITYLEGQKYPRVTTAADAAKATEATDPIDVVVNFGTAGPAELVAAALLDNGRGQVVGDHTFGQGSLQKLLEVGDGSAVLLTVARYYTPKGKALQLGVTPSVAQVQYAGALPDEDFPAEGVAGAQPDLQMQKAIELLQAKPAAAGL